MTADDIIDEYIGLYPDKMDLLNETAQKNSIDNTTKVDYIDLGNMLKKLEGDEKTIVETIGLRAVHIDEIIDKAGFPARKVLASLTMLELGGYVSRDNIGNWRLPDKWQIN